MESSSCTIVFTHCWIKPTLFKVWWVKLTSALCSAFSKEKVEVVIFLFLHMTCIYVAQHNEMN